MTVRSHNGNVTIQAARNIRLTGRGGGDITVEQSGAGFSVKADGTVRLFGNTVTLKADQGVTFNGPVSYEVPGSNQPERVSVPKSKPVVEIPALVDEHAANELSGRVGDPRWGVNRPRAGTPVPLSFRYNGCTPGSTAEVAIYCREGEAVEHLDTLRVDIEQAGGAQELTWTPCAGATRSQLETAENGKVTPMAFFFEVTLEGETSGPSDVLMFTKNVRIQLNDTGEHTFPDGARTTLIAADGTRHRGSIHNGELRFNDVVVGHYKVFLDQYKHQG
ncbi:hypothetical protein CAI21_22305 [Alkalilimnicola ehrlichii]|nr:hypothetical protein CAI21_22305 [Alkalilimnicola ehrlichii]